MSGPTFPTVWKCPKCTDYTCDSCIDLINRIKMEMYTLESKKMAKDETKTIGACKHCGYPVQSNVIHHCQVENARANEDWTQTKRSPVIGSSGEVMCTDSPSLDSDEVNYPKHYRSGNVYETINVIEAWQLSDDYYLACVIKYISRWKHKGGVQDLEKARWYLNRRIENFKKDDKPR